MRINTSVAVPYSDRSRPWSAMLTMVAMFLLMSVAAFAQQQYEGDIKIVDPAEGKQFEVGQEVTIRFYLTMPKEVINRGNYFTIEYTTDKENWYTIAEEVRNDGEEVVYNWKTSTKLESGKYMIRIRELPNPETKPFIYHKDGFSGWFELIRPCDVPAIHTELKSVRVCEGDAVEFSLKVTAREAVYEWYRNDEVYAITQEPSLLVESAGPKTVGEYYVIAKEACGVESKSNRARIDTYVNPTITQQPVPSVALCEGESTTLRVKASGDIASYQWRHNGKDIEGATGTSLFIDPVNTSTIGDYDVVVTGTCPVSVTSDVTTITARMRPVFTSQPEGAALCAGTTTTLSVTVEGENLAYQWYRDEVLVANATSPTLEVRAEEPGAYVCMVRSMTPNPQSCAQDIYSSIARIAQFTPPAVVVQPTSQDGCIGGSVTFVASAQGNGLSYEWYKNGVKVPGGNSYALVVGNLTPASAGNYSVRITGTCDLSIESQVATLTIIKSPTLVTNPVDQSVNIGERVELTVAGTDARDIQWYRNSQIIPGATNDTLIIESAALANSGVYNAVLRNGCGAVTSGYARVRVKDPASLRPELTLSQASADFGEIPKGYGKEMTMTNVIKNTGKAPLEISSIVVTGEGYAITTAPTLPLTIPVDGTATVVLSATAANVGAFTGLMTVTSTNAPVPSEAMVLNAQGVVRYGHADKLDFDKVIEDASKELCVTLTNTSSVAIKIDNVTIDGTDKALFTIVSTMPIDIAAGATAEVCVKFAPGSQGAKDAVLNIMSSTGGNSSLALAGTGDKSVSVDEGNDMNRSVAVYPNPATDNVTIRPASSNILGVDIVDVTGMRVMTLEASSQELRWNTRNASGTLVPTGIYTLVIRMANGITTVPVAIVR